MARRLVVRRAFYHRWTGGVPVDLRVESTSLVSSRTEAADRAIRTFEVFWKPVINAFLVSSTVDVILSIDHLLVRLAVVSRRLAVERETEAAVNDFCCDGNMHFIFI